MTKDELRKQYNHFRKNLPKDKFEERNNKLIERFFNYFELKGVHTIHFFVPILANREVDTWEIVAQVREKYPDMRFVIPRSNPDDFSMDHFQWKEDTQLKQNRWGIPEPVNGKPFPVEEIDMVLVPLLVFDHYGDRVGYGKGFYDRFLKNCPPDTQKIGLSLMPPVEKICDTDENDVKLDYCVTPDRVWKF